MSSTYEGEKGLVVGPRGGVKYIRGREGGRGGQHYICRYLYICMHKINHPIVMTKLYNGDS